MDKAVREYSWKVVDGRTYVVRKITIMANGIPFSYRWTAAVTDPPAPGESAEEWVYNHQVEWVESMSRRRAELIRYARRARQAE